MTRSDDARPAGRGAARPSTGRRPFSYAAGLAAAGILAATLAGCGSSTSSPTLSAASTSGAASTPSATGSASAAVAAQAKALLARVHFAEAKLGNDYTWVAAALGPHTSLAASNVLLFVSERSAVNGAKGAMVNAAHAARSAAQASPRDCATVASQRQVAYRAYDTGVAAYNDFVRQGECRPRRPRQGAGGPRDGAAGLQRAEVLRRRAPRANINMGTESGLALAHGTADDAALKSAVQSAQTSLAAAYASLQKVRGNVANIAPVCG